MFKKFFSKKNIIENLLFLALFAFLMFTDLGSQARAKLQSYLLFSPDIVEEITTTLSSEDFENFTFHDMNGREFKLSDFDNEIIILNFWATWCPPCMAEMPSLEKLYKKHKNKVNFILISDEDTPKLKAFLIKKNYSLPIYNYANNIPEKLISRSLPTTFLISKGKDILIHETSSKDWNSKKINEILDNLER